MAFYKYGKTSNKLIPITSEGSVGIPVGAVQGFVSDFTNQEIILGDNFLT